MPVAEVAEMADVLLLIIEFELEVVMVAAVVVAAAFVLLTEEVAEVTPPSAEDNRDSLNSGDEKEPVSLRVVLSEGELFDILLFIYIIILCI
jgi:hypothetical protein